MLTFQEGQLEIDSCPECYGLWFDGEELKNFIPSQSLANHILGEDKLAESVTSTPRAEGQKRLCPACKTAFSESKVGEVWVDVCFHCRGIWLDRGELSRIYQGFQQGERGNLVVLNQLAEGFRALRKKRESQ